MLIQQKTSKVKTEAKGEQCRKLATKPLPGKDGGLLLGQIF